MALPEVPLLAVLPGTGGLTRVTDKCTVRRDHADFFCSFEEGIKGKRAVAGWVVDEIVPNSKLEAKVAERAKEFAASSKRNGHGKGVTLTPLKRTIDDSGLRYGFVNVDIDRAARIATISIKAPEAAPPADIDGLVAQGASFWPLQVARELDDAILHLRINELEIAMLLFKSHGDRRQRGRLRRLPRGQQGALAGQRDQAVLEAGAEAHRRHLAHAGDAGGARLLLRRHARRTRVRRRPFLHADRLSGRATTARRRRSNSPR